MSPRSLSIPRTFTWARWLACVGVLAWGATALAQGTCEDELQRVAQERADAPPAARAAALVRRGVEALEPAYPVTHANADGAVAAGAPGAEDARWLARRGFLPGTWEAPLDAAAWETLLNHWLGRYDAASVTVDGALDPEAMAADAAAAVAAASEAVRPLALLATENDDSGALAFTGVIWNWTPRPRFLLHRPGGRLDDEGGVEAALEQLGNCAFDPRHYLLADADTAASLYLGSEQSSMRILATEPDEEGPELPLEVPNGDEFPYLTFEAAEMRGVRVAAVSFEGPGPGMLETLDLLGSTESNVNPLRFGRFFQFPP